MTQEASAVILARYRRLVWLACKGAGLWAVILGVTVLLQGERRWSQPSYRTAVDLAGAMGLDPHHLWGWVAAVVGALTLVPVRKVCLCGLYGIAVWCNVLAISFLVSATRSPISGMTGFFAQAFVGTMVVGLIVVRLVDKKV